MVFYVNEKPMCYATANSKKSDCGRAVANVAVCPYFQFKPYGQAYIVF